MLQILIPRSTWARPHEIAPRILSDPRVRHLTGSSAVGRRCGGRHPSCGNDVPTEGLRFRHQTRKGQIMTAGQHLTLFFHDAVRTVVPVKRNFCFSMIPLSGQDRIHALCLQTTKQAESMQRPWELRQLPVSKPPRVPQLTLPVNLPGLRNNLFLWSLGGIPGDTFSSTTVFG